MVTQTTAAPALSSSRMPLPELRIYNTLSHSKEPFRPLQPPKVGMYLCGPTVYKEAHIGHMVGPVIFDTVKRYLTYCGYQVTWVVNITDVDDKLIGQSRERGIPMSQVAVEMTADYLANLKELGVNQIDQLPRATDHIDGIIRFIESLESQGFAYANGGDVFFDIARDPHYGSLSNRMADQQQGEGGEAASRKRSPGDFALWKSAKPGEPAWDSPWSRGRPGWHIECSAMSHYYLGETFDIHGGGLDLVFPHHENERAQSSCCHGKPMVKYWMHNGLMRAGAASGKVGGKSDRDGADANTANAAMASPASNEEATSGKISRSKGAGGLADLIRRHSGERIRFFLLRTHYRSTIVFNDEGLQEAGVALMAFYRLFERYQEITGESAYTLLAPRNRHEGAIDAGGDPTMEEIASLRDQYLAHMDDDFNTGGAMSILFEFVRSINKHIDKHSMEESAKRTPQAIATLRRAMQTLRELSGILGLFQKPLATAQGSQADDGKAALADKLMELLIQMRIDARTRKDFAMADTIRNALTGLGVTLMDKKESTIWKLENTK
jgi:cysteinyl-tRNA synthetase